jgi:hypothetical protein
MLNIDWFNIPYNHKWEKNVDSVMNPGTKITWPQFVAEMVIYWRTQFLKDYKDIQRGPNWYRSIPKAVRDLNQQASVICNFFEHPSKEPLVTAAFKNWFRTNKPMKIGQFRKVRSTIKNGRQVSNITQDEKTAIIGIAAELEKLIKQRNAFATVAPKEQSKPKEDIKFKTSSDSKKKGLADILALEQQITKPSN